MDPLGVAPPTKQRLGAILLVAALVAGMLIGLYLGCPS